MSGLLKLHTLNSPKSRKKLSQATISRRWPYLLTNSQIGERGILQARTHTVRKENRPVPLPLFSFLWKKWDTAIDFEEPYSIPAL
ncbi:hypothetical protein SADUNF_Sadunf05G0185300 [Salix dunnii]|uniref:Uncharacterized protein n=1 Tax=Salix dunnii TaxID=1413687 RepID=A0A835K2R1_9ROSI|nr:hypothetical protein SADUNF_Sadunf05G0185300 [Salix dunnii]